MSYCTLQQLKDRFSERLLIEISDRADAPTGQIDAALIERAIADADALIDMHLKARYRLPLAAVPPMIVDLSLAIAIYKAHAVTVAEKIRDDYKGALKLLEQLRDGVIRLDVAGVEPAGGGAGEVRTNQPERPLSAAAMKGYI